MAFIKNAVSLWPKGEVTVLGCPRMKHTRDTAPEAWAVKTCKA